MRSFCTQIGENMINPAKLMKIKSSWDLFCSNHPKFPLFLRAASKNAMCEGTVIEIQITQNNGERISTNVKLTDSDAKMFQDMLDMLSK